MLHRMLFHLSVKVIALHLYNSTAKAYICNHSGIVSLSRLAFFLLTLANMHGITPFPEFIPTSS